jgi:hypothetical protein
MKAKIAIVFTLFILSDVIKVVGDTFLDKVYLAVSCESLLPLDVQ